MTRKGQLFQIAGRRDELVPLLAGNLTAFSHKPELDQSREGEINIVAPKQDMLADSDASDNGGCARRIRSQLEQAEIRCASANVDDQDVPVFRAVAVRSFLQRVGPAGL